MQLDKLTEARQAEPKRSYDDACGTAHALDLIGERWALLVLRELMLGPRRFSELKADLPGISANVLAQRLVRTIKEDVRGTQFDAADPSMYAGRMCLPELINVTPALRDLIIQQESETLMLKQAQQDGYLTMREWGEMLVEQGVTTKEEVERVTS